MERAKGMIDT